MPQTLRLKSGSDSGDVAIGENDTSEADPLLLGNCAGSSLADRTGEGVKSGEVLPRFFHVELRGLVIGETGALRCACRWRGSHSKARTWTELRRSKVRRGEEIRRVTRARLASRWRNRREEKRFLLGASRSGTFRRHGNCR